MKSLEALEEQESGAITETPGFKTRYHRCDPRIRSPPWTTAFGYLQSWLIQSETLILSATTFSRHYPGFTTFTGQQTQYPEFGL